MLVAVSAMAVLLTGCGSGSLPAGCEPRFKNQKYCLDHGDRVVVEGSWGEVELFRVVAMRDIVVKFPGGMVVKVADRGDRGGYVQGEWNLSVDGAAWVGDDARVFARGNVSQNAFVYGKAEVSGAARIFGNAQVFGKARVLDNARVHGQAEVFGNAAVFVLAETVFEPGDPVHRIWTNSFHDKCGFTMHIDSVTSGSFLLDSDVSFLEWCEADWEAANRLRGRSRHLPNRIRPTEIADNARVNGNARVWGGSHILGNGLVTGNARVSRQTILSGMLCGDLWLNSGGSSGIEHGGC